MNLKFKLRFFSGDGPARQFEAGQQRGGNYSCICGIHSKNHINLDACLNVRPIDLEERRAIFIKGDIWTKIQDGNLNPFQHLRKNEIVDELEAKGVDTYRINLKPELQEELTTLLHGICRPPALLVNCPQKTTEDLEIEKYEVLPCEPLHDITNVVQNLLTELPHHIEEKTTKAQLEKFCSNCIGDKSQIKGSDARLYMVKLAKFIENLHNDNKISNDIYAMINALVDIIKIAYSPEEKRNPRQLLRLFNQTFLFGVLAKTVINNPIKMTSRKFYGSHFHSITIHLPEVYKIINTKSILAEQEERSFGSLRRIAEATTNRKSGWIIDNTVLRYNAQDQSDDRVDSFATQDSNISQQSRLLSRRPNTTFSRTMLLEKSSVLQSHRNRISDFLAPGYNVWWHYNGKEVVFHDGVDEPTCRVEGPFLSNYTTTNLKREVTNTDTIWQTCMESVKSGKLVLPLFKLKKKEGKIIYISTGLSTVQQHRTPTDDIHFPIVPTEEDDGPCTDNVDNISEDTVNYEVENYSDLDMSDVIPIQSLPKVPAHQEEGISPSISYTRIYPTVQISKKDSMSSSLHDESNHHKDGDDGVNLGLPEPKPSEIFLTNSSKHHNGINNGEDGVNGLPEPKQPGIFLTSKSNHHKEGDDGANLGLPEPKPSEIFLTNSSKHHNGINNGEDGVNGLPEPKQPGIFLTTKSNHHKEGDDGVNLGPPEPKPSEIFLTNTNELMKRKYSDFIADLKQAICKDKMFKPREKVKRKLFCNQDKKDTDESESDMDCPFTDENAEESMEKEEEEMISTTNLILKVLGETPEVTQFLKYRKLAYDMPSTFLSRYETTKAIIETRVLKRHTELRNNTQDVNNKKLLKMTESIMDRWGTYYKF